MNREKIKFAMIDFLKRDPLILSCSRDEFLKRCRETYERVMLIDSFDFLNDEKKKENSDVEITTLYREDL